jgi:hypothetical protein
VTVAAHIIIGFGTTINLRASWSTAGWPTANP